MGTSDAPRRISNRELSIDVTGYLMPANDDRSPILVGMAGTDDLFILLFSNRELLVRLTADFGIDFERVQIVTDGRDFLDGIIETNAQKLRPYRIRVAIDMYKTPNGKQRFSEPWFPDVPIPEPDPPLPPDSK